MDGPDLFVVCDCGKAIDVAESAAGTKVTCTCGRVVSVPSLLQLRRQCGMPAQLNPVLQIECLLAGKQLPTETNCVQCGNQTEAIFTINALCESIEREDASLVPWWWFLLPGRGFMAWALSKQSWREVEERERGNHVHLPLPVRLCPGCHDAIRKLSRWGHASKLRELLHRVPLYKELLDRYPKAKLSAPE